MKTKLLVKLTGAFLLAFPAVALISAFLFKGDVFSERFRSGIDVMTTLGFDTLVPVPRLLAFILAITGHVLSIGIFACVGLILLKLIVRVVVQEKQEVT